MRFSSLKPSQHSSLGSSGSLSAPVVLELCQTRGGDAHSLLFHGSSLVHGLGLLLLGLGGGGGGGAVFLRLMAPMAGVLAGVLPGLGITWLAILAASCAVSEIGKGGT